MSRQYVHRFKSIIGWEKQQLSIKLSSADLGVTKELKLGDNLDITSVNAGAKDLSISVTGFSDFLLKNIRFMRVPWYRYIRLSNSSLYCNSIPRRKVLSQLSVSVP